MRSPYRSHLARQSQAAMSRVIAVLLILCNTLRLWFFPGLPGGGEGHSCEYSLSKNGGIFRSASWHECP